MDVAIWKIVSFKKGLEPDTVVHTRHLSSGSLSFTSLKSPRLGCMSYFLKQNLNNSKNLINLSKTELCDLSTRSRRIAASSRLGGSGRYRSDAKSVGEPRV